MIQNFAPETFVRFFVAAFFGFREGLDRCLLQMVERRDGQTQQMPYSLKNIVSASLVVQGRKRALLLCGVEKPAQEPLLVLEMELMLDHGVSRRDVVNNEFKKEPKVGLPFAHLNGLGRQRRVLIGDLQALQRLGDTCEPLCRDQRLCGLPEQFHRALKVDVAPGEMNGAVQIVIAAAHVGIVAHALPPRNACGLTLALKEDSVYLPISVVYGCRHGGWQPGDALWLAEKMI